MLQSEKILASIFVIFIIFGLLSALGYMSESIRGGFYMSMPILTAGWYGAHAKEHEVESPISIVLILLTLFILPIGIAYYFFKNYERKTAALMFSKALFVGVLLLCIPAIFTVIVEKILT